ncbi:hypothetical protein JL721_1418 [Aureococcus anophagefferens]|nr:hypothetical protein JL721_1418 [Aureococcus anophagefferens]
MGWNIFQSDEAKLHEDEVEQYVQEAKHAKHAEFGPSAPDNGCCVLLGRCCVHHCVACRRGCVDFCAPIGAWWAGVLRYWCPDLGDQCCELDPNAFLGGPLDPRSLRERRRGLCWAALILLAALAVALPLAGYGGHLVGASKDVDRVFEKLGRVCKVEAVVETSRMKRLLKPSVKVYEYAISVTTDDDGATYTSGPVAKELDVDTPAPLAPEAEPGPGDLPDAYSDEQCGDVDCVALRDPGRRANALYSRLLAAHRRGVPAPGGRGHLPLPLARWRAESKRPDVATEQPGAFTDDLDDAEAPPSPGRFNGERAGANTMEVVVPEDAEPGSTVEYPTPDGGTTLVDIPDGATPGTVLKVAY